MDDYPKAITKDRTKIIFNQMNDSFYKIQGKDKKFGIGFFSKIKIKQKVILVLMTSNKIMDEKFIENNVGFNVEINGEINLMKFGDKRFHYINKKYDLSIIEIKENKNFRINFLEIDESLYEKEPEMLYNKVSMYIIHHNIENEISVSYGIINYINKFEILCSCNIKSNGNISPIFNLYNNKLIGIYKNNSKYFIKGIFFKLIINEFRKLININKNAFAKKNEIDIVIKIYNEDVKKDIYFLNNEYKNYQDKDLVAKYNIEDLNELNTELYINNQPFKYKKYFKPEKEGEYKIKLNFFINLTNCSHMFAGCENIVKLVFISFNTLT